MCSKLISGVPQVMPSPLTSSTVGTCMLLLNIPNSNLVSKADHAVQLLGHSSALLWYLVSPKQA